MLSSLLHFLIALPIVFTAAAIAGKLSVALILGLPFVVLVQFLLTLSIVYAVAALHVSFRDVQYLLSIFLLLGFYLSPVLYARNDVPARFRWLYDINPMVPRTRELSRNGGRGPDAELRHCFWWVLVPASLLVHHTPFVPESKPLVR